MGFVVQAYRKRCPFVLDFIIDLARRCGHRMMVRLVKGAYWDGEIKRAQVEGLEGFPVFTRKIHTDVSYIACARKLLAATDAVFPQFATHNAHSLATIHEMAGGNFHAGKYEFQCLHGMGEPLYDEVVGKGKLDRPCRIYAPVGTHETLLAYLVRRLLENGANSSFVNRIADPDVSIDELIADPVAVAKPSTRSAPRTRRSPCPRDLFGSNARTPPASTFPTNSASPPCPQPCSPAPRPATGRPPAGRRPADRRGPHRPQPGRPPRHRRRRDRRLRRPDRRRPDLCRDLGSRLGRDPAGPARRLPAARRRPDAGAHVRPCSA